MKKIICICLLTLIAYGAFCQNTDKALKNVEYYIKSKLDNPASYTRVKLLECYKETNGSKIEKKLKITTPIIYSLTLTYKMGDSLIDHHHFHMDKNYHVLGVSTEEEIINTFLFFNSSDVPLDSSQTFSTIRLKNEKSKKQVTYQKGNLLYSYEADLFSQELNNQYLNGKFMLINEPAFIPFVSTLHIYIDTCKSKSISLNDLSKTVGPKNASFISSIAQRLNETFLKNKQLAITDLKTNTNIEILIETIKKIEFEEFTRVITSYQTEDKMKTIDTFQVDHHDKNKK